MSRLVLALGLCGSVLGALEPPTVHVPFTAAPVSVDGVLDDAAWTRAGVITALLPAQGSQRSAAQIERQPTEIRLLWDAQALYVSFRCIDDDIYAAGTVAHDGNVYTDDVCEVFLDPKGDGRQWIEIQVNPLNQTLDLNSLNVGDPACKPSGRLVSTIDLFAFREWEAIGMKTASGHLREGDKVIGWTVEMAIPASALTKRLGTKELSACTMRGNLMRYDHPVRPGLERRDMLFMNWSPVEPGCPHISPAAMGTITLDPAGP